MSAGGSIGPHNVTAAARSAGAATLACTLPVARRSACVRAAHHLDGGFDMPPGLGLLPIALLFEGRCFLRGLGDGLVAVRFQQLPGVVLDFDFVHSHGVISSSACDGTTPITRERLTSTPI